MKLETAFGDWLIQEDTVIDLQNGLMWPRLPLGEVTIGCGKIVEESWASMTKKYGRGVRVDDSGYEYGLYNQVIQARPASTYERGYTPGQERVTYAGFSDWRLPTLDKAATLTFNERFGTRKIKIGEEDSKKIIRILFNASCLRTDVSSHKILFCTANRIGANSTAISVLLDILNWLARYPTPIWGLVLDAFSDLGPMVDCWPGGKTKKYSALLVRRHNP